MEFQLAGCSNLRQARGDLYEQFRIQKATVGTSEVQIFIRRNSGSFALCYREAFRRYASPTKACLAFSMGLMMCQIKISSRKNSRMIFNWRAAVRNHWFLMPDRSNSQFARMTYSKPVLG